MSNVELVQIIVSVDGKLCQVLVPEERKTYLLHMMSAVFDDGKLVAAPLPEGFHKISLAEVSP